MLADARSPTPVLSPQGGEGRSRQPFQLNLAPMGRRPAVRNVAVAGFPADHAATRRTKALAVISGACAITSRNARAGASGSLRPSSQSRRGADRDAVGVGKPLLRQAERAADDFYARGAARRCPFCRRHGRFGQFLKLLCGSGSRHRLPLVLPCGLKSAGNARCFHRCRRRGQSGSWGRCVGGASGDNYCFLRVRDIYR